jgi:hypothetical protein
MLAFVPFFDFFVNLPEEMPAMETRVRPNFEKTAGE